MPSISSRDVILLAIAVDPVDGVTDSLNGITRLQKYLFLLEKEHHLHPTANGFEFEAYKAGPFSRKVYDDLEFLENLDLVRSEVAAESTDEEKAEVDALSFDDLIGGDGSSEGNKSFDSARSPDSYEERRYTITEKGKAKLQELLAQDQYSPVADGIRKIKSQFGSVSLSDLIYYVYTKYPDSATESEIRDKILARRFKR